MTGLLATVVWKEANPKDKFGHVAKAEMEVGECGEPKSKKTQSNQNKTRRLLRAMREYRSAI